MSERDDTDVGHASAWDPNVLPPPGSARDDLALLATTSMRARRRPGAIGAMWLCQAALAGFVALPASAAVASWFGRHPMGDAPLWKPGALPLIDVFIAAHDALRETFALAGLVFLAGGFVELLPLAGLVASIAYVTRDLRAPSLRAIASRAAAAFPTFATLFAMASLVEAGLAAAAFFAGIVADKAAQAELGDARADQVGVLVMLAVLAVAAVVGVLHDLARAGAIRFRVRALRAWRLAFNALARAPLSVLWSWAWRAAAGWVPVAIGALVAARLGGKDGAALAALFVVHQLVLGVRVAFRASWLAKALRAVDRAHRVVTTRPAPPPTPPTPEIPIYVE